MVRLVLSLAVLFGTVQSGGRYFYCEALGLMPSDPCAQASSAAHGGPVGTLSEQHTDCCEVVTLAAMPQAAQVADFGVPPTPCAGIVAAPSPSASMPFVATAEVER
ncbi:MAG: hypothetical protein ACRENE_13205, partial [Polyangiaceae bacterium]